MPNTRKPYPPEFREEMVALVRAGRTPEDLAHEFEPTAQSISNWVAQADRDTGRRTDGLTTTERAELTQLRRENRQLKLEREILSRRRAARRSPTRTRRSWCCSPHRPRPRSPTRASRRTASPRRPGGAGRHLPCGREARRRRGARKQSFATRRRGRRVSYPVCDSVSCRRRARGPVAHAELVRRRRTQKHQPTQGSVTLGGPGSLGKPATIKGVTTGRMAKVLPPNRKFGTNSVGNQNCMGRRACCADTRPGRHTLWTGTIL